MRASIIHRAVEAVNLQVLAQVLQVAFFASFATPLRILRLRALKLLTAKGRKVKSPRSRTAPPLFLHRPCSARHEHRRQVFAISVQDRARVDIVKKRRCTVKDKRWN
jgi:hypothetical protein